MNIQLFINKQGIVYGNDNKRIYCDREGVLLIGSTKVQATTKQNSSLMTQLMIWGR